jgi:ElaB/YqjD/DUF883 family membrane-anchored ribosome-binding protein
MENGELEVVNKKSKKVKIIATVVSVLLVLGIILIIRNNMEYSNLIKQADSSMSSKDYSKAVELYNKALTVKNGEDAKSKLSEAKAKVEAKAEEARKKVEAEKALAERLKELDIVITMAKTINQRTNEVHLIASKMDSGELNTISDIKREITRIDTKVRTMIETQDSILKTGVEATDTIINLLKEMAISLDESLIKLIANINKDDTTGFKIEYRNIMDIKDNTNKIIEKLGDLKDK